MWLLGREFWEVFTLFGVSEQLNLFAQIGFSAEKGTHFKGYLDIL